MTEEKKVTFETWVRAPEATRCTETVTWPGFTGIGTCQCDHEKGHEGHHQYMSAYGMLVSF